MKYWMNEWMDDCQMNGWIVWNELMEESVNDEVDE